MVKIKTPDRTALHREAPIPELQNLNLTHDSKGSTNTMYMIYIQNFD